VGGAGKYHSQDHGECGDEHSCGDEDEPLRLLARNERVWQGHTGQIRGDAGARPR